MSPVPITWTRGVVALLGAGALSLAALTGRADAQPGPDRSDPPRQQQQQQRSDRSDERDRPGPGWGGMRGGGGGGPGRGMGPGGPGMFGGDGGQPTAEELDQLRDFAANHSPRRWDALQRLDAPARQRIERIMALRYRGIERLRHADPDTYQLRVARVEKEDEVFGLWRGLMDAPADEVAPLRDQLRAAVRELVELGLEERRLRLTRLEQRLAAERGRLEQDQSDIDALVEQHLSSVESQGLGSLIAPGDAEGDAEGPPRDGGGMGRGPGPGGGPGFGPGPGPRGGRPPEQP